MSPFQLFGSGIDSVEQRAIAVDLGIGSFHRISMVVQFLVEVFVSFDIPVVFVQIYIGIYLLVATVFAEDLGIESGIRREEQPFHRGIGLFERSGNDIELYLYIVKVVMVVRHGLRHGHDQKEHPVTLRRCFLP